MQAKPECPVHSLGERFDPLDLTNPFPILEEARDEEAVFYSADINYWVITRYEDIKAVFRDYETYTAENTITPIAPFSDTVKTMLEDGDYTPQPVLSNNIPPSHSRIRSYVNKLFTPRRMNSFESAVRNIANQAIDKIIDKKSADIVSELTYEYPAYVLFHVLGIPEADVAQVKQWAGNRLKLYYGRPSQEEQIAMAKNLVPFWKYTVNLVHDKLNNPQDDLTSDLIRLREGDDGKLTLNEIASCMITLLVAGHETTTAQINNGLLHYLSQAEYWNSLCKNPEIIPKAVEEMMRYDPSVCAWRRLARKTTTIGGVEIPEGANLLLMLNSANRDASVFPEPEKIDFGRSNVKDHLALGYGIHYCVGAPLARLEMGILLEMLTQGMPGLRLVPHQKIEYVRNISFRGPQSLQVEW